MEKLTMEMDVLITLKNDSENEEEQNIGDLSENNNYIYEEMTKYNLDKDTRIRAKLGSLNFKVKEKDLPFDFINKDYKIEILNDKQFLLSFKGFELSEDFDFDYPKIKLSRKDLTVEFFNNTKDINTFYLDLFLDTKELKDEYVFTSDYFIEVKKIKFYNENDDTSDINQKVIDNYNQKILANIPFQ